jgi:uncharacterized protein (DUF1330 family)
MTAYVLTEVEVRDASDYENYRRLVGPTVEAFGGRYLIRGGHAEVVEGDWLPRRMVLLAFPTVAAAKAWYDSPGYVKARAIRHRSSQSTMLLIEGV